MNHFLFFLLLLWYYLDSQVLTKYSTYTYTTVLWYNGIIITQDTYIV